VTPPPQLFLSKSLPHISDPSAFQRHFACDTLRLTGVILSYTLQIVKPFCHVKVPRYEGVSDLPTRRPFQTSPLLHDGGTTFRNNSSLHASFPRRRESRRRTRRSSRNVDPRLRGDDDNSRAADGKKTSGNKSGIIEQLRNTRIIHRQT